MDNPNSESWKSGIFGDIALVEMGQSPPGNSYNSEGKGIPLLNGPTEFTDRFPIAKQWTTKPTKLCRKDDILLCVRGSSTGRINVSNGVYCIGRGVAAIRAKSDKDSTQFLEYLLYHCSQRILARTAGSTFPNIDKKSLNTIPVLIPPSIEQHKIAAILGAWDEAITLTEKLIQVKQRRKKALMQQLLTGKVRFGEFGGEWREAKLEEVADILFSNVDKKIEPEETSVRLCNYMDVYTNFYITDALPFMVGSATENEIQKFTLFKDDVIITKDSETPDDIANAAVVSEHLENTVCGYHLAIIRPHKKKVDGTFLMHHLHHPAINNQFARLANGVTRYGLTTNSVKHAKVKLPSLEEQCRIAAVLQTCDAEIELLQQKLAALRRQRKGLMQQLLTGRVRVNALTPTPLPQERG